MPLISSTANPNHVNGNPVNRLKATGGSRSASPSPRRASTSASPKSQASDPTPGASPRPPVSGAGRNASPPQTVRKTDSPALRKEWRAQLLREAAYMAQFTGMEDTSRALAGAAIGKLDRAAARRQLGPLIQYQRGLLPLIEPRRKENVAPKINESRLHGMVLDRRLKIAGKLTKLQYEAIFGPTEWPYDPITDGPNLQSEEDLSATKLWRQQPGEPDQHFYWFQIYLSLMFFQSTAQVANMAGIRQESTVARIARKWNWQERAAAFDAYHAGDPLARVELQLHLLHDKAFEAHLRGLLDSTRALETAEIGSLDMATARQYLSPLLRRQRSFLQSFWRQYEAIDGKSADEHRDLLLASLVDKKAIQMLREEEEDERKNGNLKRAYGSKDDEE